MGHKMSFTHLVVLRCNPQIYTLHVLFLQLAHTDSAFTLSSIRAVYRYIGTVIHKYSNSEVLSYSRDEHMSWTLTAHYPSVRVSILSRSS
jgi:hypothetical protein